jgi:hypothetical protein
MVCTSYHWRIGENPKYQQPDTNVPTKIPAPERGFKDTGKDARKQKSPGLTGKPRLFTLRFGRLETVKDL